MEPNLLNDLHLATDLNHDVRASRQADGPTRQRSLWSEIVRSKRKELQLLQRVLADHARTGNRLHADAFGRCDVRVKQPGENKLAVTVVDHVGELIAVRQKRSQQTSGLLRGLETGGQAGFERQTE